MFSRFFRPAAAKSSVACAATAAVEAMENRTMFSATLEAAGTELVVRGTSGNDNIAVQYSAGQYTVVENGVSKLFNSGVIKTIKAFGYEGNDRIELHMYVPVNSYLDGGAGNDVIFGGLKDDAMFGGSGDDRLDGRTGGDYFNGGTGTDTADYSDRYAPLVISLGSATLKNDGVMGEEGDDIDLSVENVLSGQGDDIIYGSSVANTIIGNAGTDKIYGYGGNDTLVGGEGIDSLYGGDGADNLKGDAGNDKLFGDAGNDVIYGGIENDFLSGGGGDDTLFGERGSDTLYGDDGNDSLAGGTGFQDRMYGGAGADTVMYIGESSAVHVSLDGIANDGRVTDVGISENDNAAADIENIIGGNGSDVLIGNDANNKLIGGAGNDRILGNGGADSLVGDAGGDTLIGGIGNDNLKGGAGNDTLVTVDGGFDIALGQEGEDIFWYDPTDAVDVTASETSAGRANSISSYHMNASKVPAGQDLYDPSLSGYAAHYGKSFSNIPLFAPGGPRMADVRQGEVGDCYFLSGLAGIANKKPDLIRQSITDLGDGTYAVKMFKDGKATFYRVDGQLPLANSDDRILFARPGLNSSEDPIALWAPIMEKVFAIHDAGSLYANLPVGWGDEAFKALGKGSDQDEVIWHTEAEMATKMRDYLTKGGAVTFTTGFGVTGLPLYSFHVYTVVDVASDLKTITIRNPWGNDDTYDKVGANDGVFKIDISTLDDGAVWINHSRL